MKAEETFVLRDADLAWNRCVLESLSQEQQKREFQVEEGKADLEARRMTLWNHAVLERALGTAEEAQCSADPPA